MKQEMDQDELLKLKDHYEQLIQNCSVKELRDLRYKLKQVKEKIRSLNQPVK